MNDSILYNINETCYVVYNTHFNKNFNIGLLQVVKKESGVKTIEFLQNEVGYKCCFNNKNNFKKHLFFEIKNGEITNKLECESAYAEIKNIYPIYDNEITKFLNFNKKILQNIIYKYNIDINENNNFKLLVSIFSSKPHLCLWAITLFFNKIISINELLYINNFIKKYGHLTSKLKKKTITAYLSKNDILQLKKEIRIIKQNDTLNKSINLFNTKQRKFLKKWLILNKCNKNNIKNLIKFYFLPREKQINFIKKSNDLNIGAFFKLLENDINILFKWNSYDIHKYIVSNSIGEIFYEDKFTILLEIKSFNKMKFIGKNSAWCISKNKEEYNNYIYESSYLTNHEEELTINKYNSRQFILFDFTKSKYAPLSMIAFTFSPFKGIFAAHDLNNNSIINLIFNILNDKKINLTSLSMKPLFEWKKENLLHYINEMNSSNIIIEDIIDRNVIISGNYEALLNLFDIKLNNDNTNSINIIDYFNCCNNVFISFNFNENISSPNAFYQIYSIDDKTYDIINRIGEDINNEIIQNYINNNFLINSNGILTKIYDSVIQEKFDIINNLIKSNKINNNLFKNLNKLLNISFIKKNGEQLYKHTRNNDNIIFYYILNSDSVIAKKDGIDLIESLYKKFKLKKLDAYELNSILMKSLSLFKSIYFDKAFNIINQIGFKNEKHRKYFLQNCKTYGINNFLDFEMNNYMSNIPMLKNENFFAIIPTTNY